MLRHERNIHTPNKNSEMSKISNQAISQKESFFFKSDLYYPLFNQLIKHWAFLAIFKT